MNQLDGVILIAILGAAYGGWRRGLIVRVLSWVGAAIGIVSGLFLLPVVMGAMDEASAEARLIAGLAIFVLVAGIGAGLGDVIGMRIRALAGGTPIKTLDHALGGVFGSLSVLLVVWLLAPAAAEVPGFASEVRNSSIATWIANEAPRPPDTATALRTIIGGTRFPEVFDELRPAPETGPPPSSFALSEAELARVTASTSNVEAFGCGSRFEGSAFTVEPGHVVTNAHVVAGADEVQIRRPDGEVRSARVVAFDDDLDLALLEVDRLGQEPLTLAEPAIGDEGAVIGYPGGQDTPRPTPARVSDDQRVTGRDIYGRDRTNRRVLFTAARLRQGDSGSPLVNSNGDVTGVVFAIAPDDPDLAYALHVEELQKLLAMPRVAGSNGRCA